jgi:hypothetical protein
MTRLCYAFALVRAAIAWGPVTHYQFACTELAGDENLESCIKNNPDLISGDDFPDAFYFGMRTCFSSRCTVVFSS